MKTGDLRSKTMDQLSDELVALMREHFNLRVQKATGQLAKNSQLKAVKRNIARVKTIVNEKRRLS